jgi:hypothetical protein
MPLRPWLALLFAAALVDGCARATDVEIRQMSKSETAASIADILKSKDPAYIWDGTADVIVIITVTDASSQLPIADAVVDFTRDRRVLRAPDGRALATAATGRTSSHGDTTLRPSFPAAGDATGTTVFVGDSKVTAQASGYRAASARISPIYRVDFRHGIKRYTVRIAIKLERT